MTSPFNPKADEKSGQTGDLQQSHQKKRLKAIYNQSRAQTLMSRLFPGMEPSRSLHLIRLKTNQVDDPPLKPRSVSKVSDDSSTADFYEDDEDLDSDFESSHQTPKKTKHHPKKGNQNFRKFSEFDKPQGPKSERHNGSGS